MPTLKLARSLAFACATLLLSSAAVYAQNSASYQLSQPSVGSRPVRLAAGGYEAVATIGALTTAHSAGDNYVAETETPGLFAAHLALGPTLVISLLPGGDLEISWLDPQGRYRLQQSVVLGGTPTWQAVPDTTRSGQVVSVRFASESTLVEQFFRLTANP